LRIIAGSAGGLKLKAPRGLATRPSSDRVREALFDILNTKVVAANFLDLFAGSGAVGIEALSRGASSVVFVEKLRSAQEIISENLHWTGLASRAKLLPLPVERAIRLLAKDNLKFDLVFMDPPYNLGLVPKTMELLADSDLVAPAGRVIAETTNRQQLPTVMGPFSLARRAEYGQTALNFYQLEDVK
jgi:16S rRNA (guanine966-N2)-methyltransferase